MINIKSGNMIEVQYEQDVNTKHLTFWLPLHFIEDYQNYDGGVALDTNISPDTFYIHDATANELDKLIAGQNHD